MKKRFLLMLSLFAVIFLGVIGQATAAESLTVHGRLEQTVEAGGWLIAAAKEKYLILNAQKFKDEAWFREGTEVEATGETKPGTITVYQEGIPFQVSSMRPVGKAGSAAVTENEPNLTRVVVAGEATIQAQPDTAVVVVAVVTQSQSALGAQQDNANKSDAVIRAVKASGGEGAEVKTSGYSLQPQYTYRENQPPLIKSYEARNAVTITLSDLSKVGTVIDAASQAGANNVETLSFTLRHDRPARDQALAEATRAAVEKAQVIAQALGGHVTRIIRVEEQGAMPVPRPVQYPTAGVVARVETAPTPIEIGALEIRSQVQLIAEIEPRP